MARLLLSSARMKVWALLPLLASSGCLFLDGLNRPPTVSLEAGISSGNKGATLSLPYSVTDDEDDHFNVQFVVRDAVTRQPLDPRCDYEGNPANGSYNVRFFRTGIFFVDASTRDSHGALSNTSTVMVTIENAPPTFAADAMLKPTSTRNACDLNTAGDVITLHLDGNVGDADAPLDTGCGAAEKLSYVWRIVGQPSGTKPTLTLYDGKACVPETAQSGPMVAAPDALTQVCLHTDPMIVGSTAMYTIVLDVSDGEITTTSPALDVPVGADQPPCILGTDPVAGSYVVDRTKVQQFGVDGVADDRDPFGGADINFAWSVWRESDPTWRDVPSWPSPTYQLDVSAFGVGEKVRVRVEALDRTNRLVPASSCPTDADDCVVASCAASPNVCHKWKTWDLELR